jgi:hypothetical protein
VPSAQVLFLCANFVGRCHVGLGSSRACRVLAIQNMMAGGKDDQESIQSIQ